MEILRNKKVRVARPEQPHNLAIVAAMNTSMTAQPHILVVEDDREIAALVARHLRAADFRVSLARDGREIDRLLEENRIDLLVLDIMLPGEDGLSLCRRLRANSNLPVIIVSAKGDEVDRIIGLEIGADDYLAKPFNPRELLARIRAVLRRAGEPREMAAGKRILVFEGWRLDTMTRQLTNPYGALVAITGAEFDLLHVLCRRTGRILSRDQLLDLTQGRAAGPSERSIDILVARLRRKIEPDAQQPRFIITVRSGGYMFAPSVEAE